MSTRPARAAFTLCNRTSYIVYAATAQPLKKNKVLSDGWTRLIPGDCATAIAGDLTAPSYFVYAHTSSAHEGPPRAWGGSASFCTHDTNFSLILPYAADCEKSGAIARPFAAVDTHRLKSWTMTLTESPALFSLNDARLAGLKRLLRDNGLRTGPIDARPDKLAAQSLVVFRARRALSATANASDLFRVLESDALNRQTSHAHTAAARH